MEGRCESDRGGDEVYPAAFGDEEKTNRNGMIMNSPKQKKT